MGRQMERKLVLSSYPEYNVWKKMRDRCNNPRSDSYQWYGAKGVKICKEWDDFSRFIKDMGRRPTNIHTIDRIDNSKGYFKENCRWATMKEQNANRSLTRNMSLNGESNPIAVWAAIHGIDKKTVYRRLRKGWGLEDSLYTAPYKPPMRYNSLNNISACTPLPVPRDKDKSQE